MREIIGLSELQADENQREDARALRISMMGARGDIKAIREELRQASRAR